MSLLSRSLFSGAGPLFARAQSELIAAIPAPLSRLLPPLSFPGICSTFYFDGASAADSVPAGDRRQPFRTGTEFAVFIAISDPRQRFFGSHRPPRTPVRRPLFLQKLLRKLLTAPVK
jgi:hypothetical protein